VVLLHVPHLTRKQVLTGTGCCSNAIVNTGSVGVRSVMVSGERLNKRIIGGKGGLSRVIYNLSIPNDFGMGYPRAAGSSVIFQVHPTKSSDSCQEEFNFVLVWAIRRTNAAQTWRVESAIRIQLMFLGLARHMHHEQPS